MMKNWLVAASALAILVFAAVTQCAAQKVVCPLLDLASEVCPLVMVTLPDGTTEQVSRDELVRATLKVRGARLARAGADAGASSGD